MPIIEIHTPDGHKYRIWPNGEIEGFPDHCMAFNRLPAGVKATLDPLEELLEAQDG